MHTLKAKFKKSSTVKDIKSEFYVKVELIQLLGGEIKTREKFERKQIKEQHRAIYRRKIQNSEKLRIKILWF